MKSSQSRHSHLSIIALLLTTLLYGAVVSANETEQSAGSGQDRLEIVELGALIVASHDGPRVAEITPAGGRLEKYQGVDLQAGDVIMAVNGQRLESLAALRDILGALQPGDQVKAAVQRFKSLKVVTFEIGSEADQLAAMEKAAGYVEIKTEAGSAEKVVAGGPQMMMFKSEDGAEPFIELAAMLDDTDGQILVKEIISLPPQLAPPVELIAGDVLTALQGQEVAKTADFVDQYSQIAVGTQVTLTLIRDNSETELTFKMPESPSKGMKVIRR